MVCGVMSDAPDDPQQSEPITPRALARMASNRAIAEAARGQRCYTRRQVIALLQLERRTFERLRKAGALPYVVELQPVIPNNKRYRADVLDRYLSGDYGTSQLLSAHKRHPRTPRPTSAEGSSHAG